MTKSPKPKPEFLLGSSADPKKTTSISHWMLAMEYLKFIRSEEILTEIIQQFVV
jgi:hypothetical protein